MCFGGSLCSGHCALTLSIRRHSRHDTPNRRRDSVHVTNATRVNQPLRDLLLRHDSHAILPAARDGREAGGGRGGFEGVLDLVEAPVGGEDGDVVVVVGVAGHGGLGGVRGEAWGGEQVAETGEAGSRDRGSRSRANRSRASSSMVSSSRAGSAMALSTRALSHGLLGYLGDWKARASEMIGFGRVASALGAPSSCRQLRDGLDAPVSRAGTDVMAYESM